ncbi:hypothetical protein KH5H1_42510 [Corallococcus caeni]|uniref:Uncharacterized protein n=2 Tax=Corallococcus TaxID=83461 RepID=A0A7Y4JTE1_9BACT|nr:hypothetical protein [Corallococcus exercitus]NOK10518.1 hypothetical protein [Corallococcus exercitus]GMU00132.1 hypothetical protein KH5H1_42510 [Corallococcus sp. KH5-1]GMU09275.1 hypothetical protein ASNO1_55280 [Corallococcus sp. NO1]
MNVKALAAVVGTLSLSALATGCASNKASEGTMHSASSEKAAEANCSNAKATDAKGAEGSCSNKPAAAPAATPEKGAEGSCGAGSCGSGSCSGKK